MTKTGIPVFKSLEYMEQTPLGSSEWIKLYSYFFDKTLAADSIVNNISSNYNLIKEEVSHLKERPKILTDLRYNNVWYLPGNKSFVSNLYRAAGAELAINDNMSTCSISLSSEEVLVTAGDAELCLVIYSGDNEFTFSAFTDYY